MSGAIAARVGDELTKPVDPHVAAMAAAIAGRYGTAARAVLFYGSCLRERQLDGLMLDFYLIVSDYDTAYDRTWLAWANSVIPPNVFPFSQGELSSKYAVLSEVDFMRLCGQGADNVSVWARFSQPSRLVWSSDDAAAQRAITAIAQAGPTLLRLAQPLVDVSSRGDWRALFEQGFAETYRAELRAERRGRSTSIVDSDPDFYRDMFDAAVADRIIDPAAVPGESARIAAERAWGRLRRRGKKLSVLRLVKASFTFAGGIDYLAWKINRHAGTSIKISPWQRRHPLIAAMLLLPRLLRSRAVG